MDRYSGLDGLCGLGGGIMTKEHIPQQVEAIAEDFAPDVVRIAWSFGDDWSGERGLFFRVVISDEAAKRREFFHTVAVELRSELSDAFGEFEMPIYTSFCSVSECARAKDSRWGIAA